MDIKYADLFGVKVINVTPHEIRFKHPVSGEEIIVPPSGIVINAIPREVVIARDGDVEHVKTEFAEDEESLTILKKIAGDGVIAIGSIIAAQAYPGWVAAMTSHPDYVRVAPKEKRMNPLKFSWVGNPKYLEGKDEPCK